MQFLLKIDVFMLGTQWKIGQDCNFAEIHRRKCMVHFYKLKNCMNCVSDSKVGSWILCAVCTVQYVFTFGIWYKSQNYEGKKLKE